MVERRPRITRDRILQKLRRSVDRHEAILGAGCSAGIIAKSAAHAGSDLIVVYSTGRTRLMGLPTWRFGDSNAVTLSMAHEILNVVRDVPVIGGVEANDPTRLDLEILLEHYVAAGFSGVINFPTLTNLPDQRARAEQVGMGFNREVDLIRLARFRDVFSMAYVASEGDAVAMADAGVDCVVVHSGPTTGGAVGYGYEGSLDQLIDHANSVIQAAIARRDGDLLVLLHGGLLSTPPEVDMALERTEAVGFLGASSIERIPVERAVSETVRAFKKLRVRRNEGKGGQQ